MDASQLPLSFHPVHAGPAVVVYAHPCGCYHVRYPGGLQDQTFCEAHARGAASKGPKR